MTTIDPQIDADSDSSTSSESLSTITDEISTASSEDQFVGNEKGMDVMKKVKKLRSMKLSKFPSLKLFSRQMRIQPDYSSFFSTDSASSQQSTPLKMLHLSPNYMKNTNSSDAKKETLQKSSRTLVKRSSFKPGKSLTRLSSSRYRNSLTRRGSGGTDLKKKVKKSRSTKLDHHHSTVSDSLSSLCCNADNSRLNNSLDSSGNKSMRVMIGTTTLRPARILTKVASLRTMRPSIKRLSEIPDQSVHRPTCSSALKKSKFPDNVELQPGEMESAAIMAKKVCPYSYCSLHGHRHSGDLPPLKKFVSMRRRQLKSQKSARSESWSRRGRRSGNAKKGNQTTQMEDNGDALVLEKAYEIESVSISKPAAEQTHHYEETSENLVDDHEFNTADNGAEFPGEASPTKNQKHMTLWGLIYKHMASGIAAAEDNSERAHGEMDKNEAAGGNTSDRSADIEDHGRGSMNRQLIQYNAIKLVQEAFDKILSEIPDNPSDDKSMDDDASADKDISDNNHREDEKSNISNPPDSGGDTSVEDQEEMLNPVSKIDPSEGERAEPMAESKSRQQTPKSWSNLKKIIILKRFFNSLEQVRSFIPRKPQYLSVSLGPEAEKVNLRRQEILGRKDSEEWMLDYALRQVISTLAPAQRRKVSLLVQAFETVTPLPEMSNLSSSFEASPQATPVQQCPDLLDRKDDECGKQIHFGVLRKTPRRDLDAKRDQDEFSAMKTVEHSPASCSDISEAIDGSNLATMSSCTAKTVVRDESQEVAVPSFKDNALKGVQTEFSDSDLMETECKLCDKSSPKPSDVQKPFSEEFSVNREVTEEVEILPVSEDHDSGSSIPKESRQLSSPCTDQSDEMNSHDISNATANSSASDSTLQGRSSEPAIGATSVKNKILQSFSNLLKESNNPITTTGAELEKQLQKRKNMRLWFMIYKHMASGATAAPEDERKDGQENDSSTMVVMSDSPSQDAGAVNDDPVDQKIKQQQLEAIRLVEEAIDGIQLPENQDGTPDDQSVTSDNTPHTDQVEREFVQDREFFISSSADSINEDRTLLGVKEPSSESSITKYEEKAGLQKTGNETKPAMKKWSTVKKLILLRRFVKSLEKVDKFTPRAPRFLPLDHEKEAEKVNLRHQDADDRKNADEWMLDYALQQAVAKLTPARKRKVALLVEAFETVIPTIEN